MEGLVGGEDYVGVPAGDGGGLVGLDDGGVSYQSDISVDVHTQIDLDEVALLERDTVFSQWGVVTTDLVDGEACGEGDAFVRWLLVVDLGTLGLNEPVGDHTGVNNLHADLEVVEDLS